MNRRCESAFFSFSRAAVVVASSLLLTTCTYSGPSFFTNEGDFQNAVSSAGGVLALESFEGLPNLTAGPFTSGIVTVSPGGGSLVTVFAPAAQATEGDHVVGWNVRSTEEVTFTFSTPIHAFGIDIIDLGDTRPPGVPGPVPGTLRLTMDTGSQVLYSDFVGPDGNVLFGGVVDAVTPFTTVTFQYTGSPDGEYIAFDRLQTATIPEPASMLLAGLGLATLGALRKRMR